MFAINAAQRFHHSLGVHGIKACHRFISQDQTWFLHQRTRNSHALLLATRKLIRALERLFIHAKRRQGIKRKVAFFIRKETKQLWQAWLMVQASSQHIRQHRKPANQIEALENHRALAAPGEQFGTAELCDIAALIKNLALAWVHQAIDHVQQGGFARA